MADITQYFEESLEGACTYCGEEIQQWKYEINDESWHPGCWYESHGYEKVDAEEDRPYSSRADREFNYRRQRTTEICGETIEWTEWKCVDPFTEDDIAADLPTRGELSPEQLGELRRRISAGEATEDADSASDDDFPAARVLKGGKTLPSVWTCPECEQAVEPADIQADCPTCGSDTWLTHGEPLTEDIAGSDPLSILSKHERCAVLLTALESPEIAANQMDIEPATVREHIEQAQRKAIEGTEAYELLVSLGIIDDSE